MLKHHMILIPHESNAVQKVLTIFLWAWLQDQHKQSETILLDTANKT